MEKPHLDRILLLCSIVAVLVLAVVAAAVVVVVAEAVSVAAADKDPAVVGMDPVAGMDPVVDMDPDVDTDLAVVGKDHVAEDHPMLAKHFLQSEDLIKHEPFF